MEKSNATTESGSDCVTISVKFDSQTLQVSVGRDAKVQDLMVRLQQMTNVLPRGQKLIFKGTVLAPESTLASAKLSSGAKIMLLASQGIHQGGFQPQTRTLPQHRSKVRVESPSVKPIKNLEKTRLEAWRTTGIVSLRESALQAVPSEVWELGPLVRALDLGDNNLIALPENVCDLKKLQRLRLSSNGILESNVSWRSLGSLKFLATLSLDHNELTTLPAEIGLMSSLKTLILSHNRLERLPEEIGSLSNLEKLDISQNRLTMIPSTIGKCTQLIEVDVKANLLTAIPLAFCELKSLKVFLLDNNALKSFPGEVLSGCQELNTLSLHGNELTIDDLREVDGWTEFDKRRKAKYSKQLEFHVIGSSAGFDEGADAKQWNHW